MLFRSLFASLLFERYGGSLSDWSPVPVRKGFLLKVPDWVTPDDLEADFAFWETNLSLVILPWQTQTRTDPLPPSNRTLLRIHNFPLDYWHPYYFRQAVSGIGVLMGVSQEGLRGSNKTSLSLLVDCYDYALIPCILRVGHGSRWSDCPVERANSDGHLQGNPPPPDRKSVV